MNSPLIWVLFPGLAAILLWFLQARQRLMTTLSIAASTLLVTLAWLLPIGVQVKIGPWSFILNDTLDLLGRTFTLTEAQKPFILFVYGITTLWLVGTYVIKIAPDFIPLALAITALLVAARAVEPFLYGALIIEMAVLLSVPMLFSSRNETETIDGEQAPVKFGRQQGVLRFLIFQMLAVPFILLTGWMVPGIEDGTADPIQPARAAILLGVGFSFLLAVFPFYSWVPLLAEQAHPYAAGFLFFMLPLAVMVFGLNFLGSYAWLRNLPGFFQAIQLAGVLMVATGGVMTAFQRHLGRIVGFASLTLTGFFLLAISLNNPGGIQVFNTQFLPVGISLWVWVFALSILKQKQGTLDFKDCSGQLWELPFVSTAILLAHFTLAGLPVLAGFPLRQALFSHLADVSILAAAWAFIGNIGFLIAGFRSLAMLVSQNERIREKTIKEKTGEVIFLTSGILALLAIGWFPQVFLPWLLNLTGGF